MKRLLIVSVWCILAVSLAVAQNTGAIQGVVSDNSGAVIPGAELTLANINTGVDRDHDRE